MMPPSTYTISPHPDFSCFCISHDCYKTVGKFDEEYYPAYAEDADYHIRMHRAGIEAISINLPFLHHASQTLATASPEEAAIIRRGADANRERFYTKYGARIGSPEYYNLF
jgi:GT2 family glycosyltransferase